MYLKSYLIAILKVKNVLLLLTGLFLFFTGIGDIISLILYYWGDWNTVLHARSVPEAAAGIIIAPVLILIAAFSRNKIRDAVFYSGYFETNLYGNVWYNELSCATGYSAKKVKRDLRFLRIFYMKRFSFVTGGNGEYIELFSKRVTCRCRNCGAVIDKNEYFTGLCPYCKTPDIFASVITDNKIYSITNDVQSVRTSPVYYLKKHINLKMGLLITALSFSGAFLFALFCMIMDYISKYNDMDYQKGLILSGKGYASIEINQKQMVDTIVWDIFFIMILLPIVIICIKKLHIIASSRGLSGLFADSKAAFIDLSVVEDANYSASLLRRCIQSGYLKNCTMENHDGAIMISLARKIVRDSCPYCGAPVSGAVGENYICGFCHNTIMGVIRKR